MNLYNTYKANTPFLLKLITVLCVFIFTTTVRSQIDKDNLWNQWLNTNQPDTVRLNSIHTIAKSDEYLYDKPDSAFYFSELCYELAVQNNNSEYIIKALKIQGVVFSIKGDTDKAFEKFNDALKIAQTEKDTLAIAKINNSLGILHYDQGDYKLALDYYTKSLTTFEKFGDIKTIIGSLTNIGSVHQKLDEYELALNYFFRCLDLAKELDSNADIARTYDHIGNVYNVQGNYSKALEYYNFGLSILEKTGGTKNQISRSLNNIGVIYHKQGIYAIAIDYYTRSLIINEKIGNKSKIARNLYNIGGLNASLKDFDKAIEYYTKCLKMVKEMGAKNSVASCLANLGLMYKSKGDHTKALDYYNQSIKIREETGDKDTLAQTLSNIGDVYNDQKNYKKAYAYYNKSLKIAKDINNKARIASALYDLAKINYMQGNYTEAIEMAKQTLTKAENIGNATIIEDSSNLLYEAYLKTNKYKQALEMYEMHIVIRDSLNSEKNQREVIKQEYKYEYDKKAFTDSIAQSKEKLIANTKAKLQQTLLEKEQKQNLYLLGLVVLLFIFSGFIYRRFQITKRQQAIIGKQRKNIIFNLKKMEEKTLRKQMNPHFIFNTINNIQYFMFLKGERETNKYFGFFSNLIRYTLDMSNADKTILQDEIEYLKSYINLEKMRLDDILEADVLIDSKLKAHKEKIPCMLIQPMIENAILHGLKPKKNDRKLVLSFIKQEDYIEVNIIDNGIGREAAAEKKMQQYNKHRRSWATYILKERIKIFNLLNDRKLTFSIEDLKDGEKALGTKVKFLIPIIS